MKRAANQITFSRDSQSRAYAPALSAYYLTVGAYAYGYFAPEGRIWGLSLYHTLPRELFYTCMALAIIAPLILVVVFKRKAAESSSRAKNGRFTWGYVLFPALAMVVFYLLRNSAHFGGDGYTLLGLLSEEAPLIKTREIGESLIHVWVKNLHGVGGRTAALFSYQALSIFSGGVYVLTAIYGARNLFNQTAERALFSLGLCSSGALLLFFGYVENYSLLVTSLLIFGVTGALALREKAPRWILVPLAALCIWLHLLGAVVIPALFYALVAGTRTGARISSAPVWLKWAGGIVVLALGAGALGLYYQQSMFFQLALLLPWQTPFSHPEYSLLSGAHLKDLLNLALVLCPWALVGTVAVFTLRKQILKKVDRPLRFFILLAISASLAVIALDPKLGMPRDWDLFSFAAPPLALLLYYTLLSVTTGLKERVIVSSLAVTLGFVALTPRVATGLIPDSATERFAEYLALDEYRSRTGVQTLQDYYLSQGDSSRAKSLIIGYYERFPEVRLNKIAQSMSARGQIDSVISVSYRAISTARDYAPAYLNLGRAYISREQYDSAGKYLRIADALNPYNPETLSALALLALKLGNKEEAREKWLELATRKTPPISALIALSQLAAIEGKWDECERYLERLVLYDNPPAEAIKTLGDLKLRAGNPDSARTYYQQAVRRGYDSSILIQFENQYGQPER